MSAYDRIADSYLAYVDTSLADPASLLSLAVNHLLITLGSVNGLEVCDVGCGEGYLTRRLAPYAGRVVGVDYSKKLLEAARSRTNAPNVEFVHDEGHMLSRLQRRDYDLVVSNLSLMDIKDLSAAYGAVHRILREKGRFVFSVMHPCFQAPQATTEVDESGLFVSRRISQYAREMSWRSDHAEDIRSKLTVYHRPLSTLINMLVANGFTLNQIVEPTLPDDVYSDPHRQAQMSVPALLIISASK